MKIDNKSFESVIPTAIHTLYPLTLTDVPYYKEMYASLERNIDVPQNLINPKIAPEVEARHKLANKLIEQLIANGGKQIIEVAAGYSCRGLKMCNNDNDIVYCELDLPEVAERKRILLNDFTKIPKNLHILTGNALNTEDLKQAEKYFDTKKELIITNEGFMRYLSFEEKRQYAENVYKLLKKYSGAWVTCDVTPAAHIVAEDKLMKGYNQNLSAVTDRNNVNWKFVDRNHVNEFMGKIGFTVEWHDFMEAKPDLTCIHKVGFSDDEVAQAIGSGVVCILRVKNS